MALTYFRQQPRIQAHAHNRGAAGPYPAELETVLPRSMCEEALAVIQGWPGYRPTPLRVMDLLAAALGLKAVYYKDESDRFGLSSLKPLGVLYPVVRHVCAELGISPAELRRRAGSPGLARITVTTATEGNIGRALAWLAGQLGLTCRVYVHDGVSEGRVRYVENLGAKVVRVRGGNIDSIWRCTEDSAANGWFMVSDVLSEPEPDVTWQVMAGYATLATEVLAQAHERITHVFVPAASGGLAAALAARFWMDMGAGRPRVVVVESETAACLLKSARRGALARVKTRETSVMAGLSCGLPSPAAWTVLRRAASDFVAVGDGSVTAALRMLASGEAGGGPVEAGECAAPAPIALIGAACDAKLRAQIGLDAQSSVLLVGTEGASDPAIYETLITAEQE